MMRLWFSLGSSLVLVFLTAAGPAAGPGARLAAEARALKGKGRPEAVQMGETRATLLQSLSELDSFLTHSGSAIAAGWKRYLRWTELQKELAKPALSADPKVLFTVYQLYLASQNGLELAPFLKVRTALGWHAQRVSVAATADFSQRFDDQLEALAGKLSQWDASQDSTALSRAGSSLGWLTASTQVAPLVSHVRAELSHPNARFLIDAKLIPFDTFTRNVDQSEVIQDAFQDIALTVRARTQGQLTASLATGRQTAEMLFHLDASTLASSVGYKDPVTLWGTSNTRTLVDKSLYLDAEGIHTRPAVARSWTASRIDNLSVPHQLFWRIIERIAWRKALEMQPAADAAMSRKAESRFAPQVDLEFAKIADNAIEYVNSFYKENLLKPMRRAGTFPELFQMSSSAQGIGLVASKADGFQLGAPTLAPALLAAPKGISFQVHASFLENFGERSLGGKTVTDESVETLVRVLAGEIPEALWVGDGAKRWSVSFPTEGAVKARLEGNQFELRFLMNGSTVDGKASRLPFEVSAKYGFQRDVAGVKTVRQGKVLVQAPKSAAPEDLDRIAFLTTKFDAFFAEEIRLDFNSLPGMIPTKGMDQLRLRDVRIENGWATTAVY